MTSQSISLAQIGDYPLKKLSMEIAKLLRNAPRFGDTIAELVAEESIRRVQGRDSVVTSIPIACASERKAALNWLSLRRLRFEQWAHEAPEFATGFLAAAEFLQKVEEANRE